MRRPLRTRIWFWKPQWYWHGWKTLIPFFMSGDEYDWHTICLGWTITGRVIIATRPCHGRGKCAEYALPTWADLEHEADEDLAAGRFVEFNTANEAMAWLRGES